MIKPNKFKLLGVAVILIALLSAIGGLVISQAAGGQSGIRALVYNDAVRFVIGNEKVSILRAEVFDLGGKRLFDSGPVMGKALDWAMATEAGERVAHGVYLYVITAWDSQRQRGNGVKRGNGVRPSFLGSLIWTQGARRVCYDSEAPSLCEKVASVYLPLTRKGNGDPKNEGLTPSA